MSDPGNLICGITIDATPLYPNTKTRETCRSLLWMEDEVGDKLKSILERSAIDSMARLIKARFKSPSYLRVCAEATGYADMDDESYAETFAVEIDIFGEADLYDPVSEIVGDTATGEAICKELQPILIRYIAENNPDVKIKWQLEVSEYGE